MVDQAPWVRGARGSAGGEGSREGGRGPAGGGLGLFGRALALRSAVLAAGALALALGSLGVRGIALALALAFALRAGLGALGVSGLLRFARGRGAGGHARAGVLLLAAAAFLDVFAFSLALDLASGELGRMTGAGSLLGGVTAGAELFALLALVACLSGWRRVARSLGDEALARQAATASALVGLVALALALTFAASLGVPSTEPARRSLVALGLLLASVAVTLRAVHLTLRLARALASSGQAGSPDDPSGDVRA